MERVEGLGDLLIVLFRILLLLPKNWYLWCQYREADQLQIVAGQGNNSFCQVSGLKGQTGKITNCGMVRVPLLFTRLTVCQCVGHRGGKGSAKK